LQHVHHGEVHRRSADGMGLRANQVLRLNLPERRLP
jgi:hypothetical protein